MEYFVSHRLLFCKGETVDRLKTAALQESHLKKKKQITIAVKMFFKEKWVQDMQTYKAY